MPTPTTTEARIIVSAVNETRAVFGQVQSELRNLASNAQTTGERFAQMRRIMATAIPTAALVAAAKEAASAALEQKHNLGIYEVTLNSVAKTMHLSGAQTKQFGGELDALAEHMHELSGFQKDDILGKLIAPLLRFPHLHDVPAAFKEIVSLGTRLALINPGQDFAEIAQELGRVFEESDSAEKVLRRFGIVLEQTEKREVELNAKRGAGWQNVLFMMNKIKAAGFGEEIFGKFREEIELRKLKTDLHELQEDFGDVILKGAEPLIKAARDVTHALRGTSDTTKQLIVDIGAAVVAYGALRTAMLAIGAGGVAPWLAGAAAAVGGSISLGKILEGKAKEGAFGESFKSGTNAPLGGPGVPGIGIVPGMPIEGRALGGPVRARGFNVVGEHGPELVQWAADGTVIPAAQTMALFREMRDARRDPIYSRAASSPIFGARGAGIGDATRLPFTLDEFERQLRIITDDLRGLHDVLGGAGAGGVGGGDLTTTDVQRAIYGTAGGAMFRPGIGPGATAMSPAAALRNAFGTAQDVRRALAGYPGGMTTADVQQALQGYPGMAGGVSFPAADKGSPTQRAIAYFQSQGWTRAQAAGIVANLHAESGMRPGATGDAGRAFGLAQWHPDRQREFARVMGKDIRQASFEEQLAFVQHELRAGHERAAGDALRRAQSAAEAGNIVSRMYERPAAAEAEASRRASLATQFEQQPPPRMSSGKMDPMAPAGTAAISRGTTVVESPSGRKFRVASEFAENFRGFLRDYEAAGGVIGPDSGGVSERPRNASYHPIGRAIDVNQIGYGVRSRRGVTLPQEVEDAIAAKWGLFPGSQFQRRSDIGHFEVRDAEAARAALIQQSAERGGPGASPQEVAIGRGQIDVNLNLPPQMSVSSVRPRAQMENIDTRVGIARTGQWRNPDLYAPNDL